MSDLNQTLTALSGRFHSVIGPVNRLRPIFSESESGQPRLSKIRHNERDYEITPRFLDSLKREYRYEDSMLKYCAPATIFDRFALDQDSEPVRVTFDTQQGEVLALVPQNTPVIEAVDAVSVIQNDPRLEAVHYAEAGVIEAEFRMDESWRVRDDSEYHQQIRLRAPVDGFTKPTISLGLIRQVCANGMWTQSTQFRSELALGHKAAVPLARILRSYNNEEGFEALRSRIDAARGTQASLNEVFALEQTAGKALLARRRPVILEQIKQITGDPAFHYSIESPRSLNAKKRSLLPAQCSVLDLVNMATELATHYRELLETNGQSNLMSFVNRTLAKEFDLEEVFEWKKKSKPLYLTQSQASLN